MGEGSGSNLYTGAGPVLRLCPVGTAARHTGRAGTVSDPDADSDSDTEACGNAVSDPDAGASA